MPHYRLLPTASKIIRAISVAVSGRSSTDLLDYVPQDYLLFGR